MTANAKAIEEISRALARVTALLKRLRSLPGKGGANMGVQWATKLSFWLICVALTIAQPANRIDWEAYERGALGPYPQVRFHTTSITVPLVHVTLWNETCDPGYTLLTPHGQRIRSNRALLIDPNGQMVWHHEERGSIKSLQIQKYKGNDYITFWVGDDNFWGHGRGYYKMFDHTYTHTHTVFALNGLEGDYHEFTITADDTALLTAWQKIPWDLSYRGREKGYIWDCIFQEIDIETDTLLFEWRASDHFALGDMKVDSWAEWTGTDDDPWDWIHLNSVDKDDKGNYLIGARYTNAISYIDGRTGDFIWHLGGRNNTFIDLTEGNVTNFVDVHMARWTDSYTAITAFDNIDHWTFDKPHKVSHGLKIKLNHRHSAVAKADVAFVHPDGVFAAEEGSIHRLPNGNYFLGYGSANVYAEFAPDGRLLCSTHYAPLGIAATSEQTNVKTYRIHKHSWVGHPAQLPDVKAVDDRLYWSWNGATQLHSWQVEGGRPSGRRSTDWTHIESLEHTSFEMALDVAGLTYPRYRLTASGQGKTLIGAWNVEADGVIREIALETPGQPRKESGSMTLFYVVVFTSVALLFFVNLSPGPFDFMRRKTSPKDID